MACAQAKSAEIAGVNGVMHVFVFSITVLLIFFVIIAPYFMRFITMIVNACRYTEVIGTKR
jgi:hypothetical protein